MSESTSVAILDSSFKEILPFWRESLWPGRQSRIEPVSAIDETGRIDMKWMKSTPFFWKATAPSGEILGVLSALHRPGKGLRLRGLWVKETERGRGIARSLLAKAEARAFDLQVPSLWTMARASALGFYEAAGYRAERTLTGYEFGPHIIVTKDLVCA